MPKGEPFLNQCELGDEPAEGWDTGEAERKGKEERSDDRASVEEAASAIETPTAVLGLHDTRYQEQAGLHDDVMGDVQDGRGEPGDREQTEPHHHVPDLAHDVEAEDALDVVLCDGAEYTYGHGRSGHEQQQARGLVGGKQQRLSSDDDEDPDLGEKPGEDRRHRRRCRQIGVGKPHEEREQRRLDAEDHEHQQAQSASCCGVHVGESE